MISLISFAQHKGKMNVLNFQNFLKVYFKKKGRQKTLLIMLLKKYSFSPCDVVDA